MARTPKSSKGDKTKSDQNDAKATDENPEADAASEESAAAGADAQSGADKAEEKGAADTSEPVAVVDEPETDSAADATSETTIEEEQQPGTNEDEEADAVETVPGSLPAMSQPEAVISAAPAAPPPAAGGGASPLFLVLGGAVAAGLGWLAATYAGEPVAPANEPSTELVSLLEAQTERVETLAAQLDDLSAASGTGGGEAVPDPRIDEIEAQLGEAVSALEARLSDFEAQSGEAIGLPPEITDALTEIDAALAALDGRLVALETAEPDVPDGSAAMEAQLEQFRAELDTVTEEARLQIEEARNRATEIEQQAAADAAAAAREAALADLRAAIQSGEPYTDAVAALGDVPEGLAAHAEAGVPTLATLQSDFPPAARAALAEAQTVPQDAGAGDRLAAFLRRQTNARSLSPREGDTTDAILSRAEAALGEGDLDAALQEVAALEGASAEAMADWRAAAQQRADAVNGLAALAGEDS